MFLFYLGIYTENVLEAVRILQNNHVPQFVSQVHLAIESLLNVPQVEIDENEFLDSSRLVYDGVRDIRRAVLVGISDDFENDTSSDDDLNSENSLYDNEIDSRDNRSNI